MRRKLNHRAQYSIQSVLFAIEDIQHRWPRLQPITSRLWLFVFGFKARLAAKDLFRDI